MPTHGSLTKAGKVRQQTPKIQPQPRKSPTPIRRNRRNYKNRILLEKNAGQIWRSRRRR